MTHKIKVQMFGNFRMDYNGAPFVAEKMHKESQFNRMMQALIHYSDCGIAKDKLEEIVIGERDIDAPHTALRVIQDKAKARTAWTAGKEPRIFGGRHILLDSGYRDRRGCSRV